MEPANVTGFPQDPQETPPEQRPRRASFPVRTFVVLAVLNLLGAVALAPFTRSLTQQMKGAAAAAMSMSLWEMLLLHTLTGLFFYVPVVALGLVVARRLGLGAPLLDAWGRGEPLGGRWRSVLVRGSVVGLAGGAVVLVLMVYVFDPLARADLLRRGLTPPDIEHPPAGESVLASFGAGVNEETLRRLFALSLLALLMTPVVGRRADGGPRTWVLWTANLVSALCFGALHLPQAAAMVPLTPWVVAQVLVGNGLLGLAFGWLYWRDGLESAMLAHFSTDLVLHVIGPLLPGG